jgi:endonuclease YncB( thermonuclease family)
MIKNGLATVYEAKTGAEFGNAEEKYRRAEEVAKSAKKGIWSRPGVIGRFFGAEAKSQESPRQFKDRMNATEKAGKEGKGV